VLLPSLWYLFHIFKSPRARPAKTTAAQLADQGMRLAFAASADAAPQGGNAAPKDAIVHPAVGAVARIVSVAAAGGAVALSLAVILRRRRSKGRRDA
ncbi:MAG: hypothetical protein ACRDHE_03820, partial [Ktedonobacterales bacterium]